ncbi:hypothetical protein F4860DRAFT_527725 [Xylaria cubensis]|nr:hypothetical protein F4860DRAFT_527725 [Xylaria cubensis]
MQAAGSTSLADGGLCLTSYEDGALVEKLFDGDEVQAQRVVANAVRANSSAAYVAGADKSFIVFTGEGNTLHAAEFDEDSEEWVESDLDGLNIIHLHPESRISAALIPDGALVFVQNAQGTVTSVHFDEKSGTWSPGFDVPGQAKAGTPLSVFITDRALAVSFLDPRPRPIATSGTLRLAIGVVISDSKFSGAVQSLLVSQDADSGSFEAYILILTGDSVEHLGKDGSVSANIGTITAGNFVPKSKAESGIYIGGNNYGVINQINYYGGGGGGCGGYICYRPPTYCRPCW